ncbi:hypothetical protein JW992_09815, partial [candidate division KSB1 bacterium]|nr:hypothetical protein [candidate division KSB1 bacterium]
MKKIFFIQTLLCVVQFAATGVQAGALANVTVTPQSNRTDDLTVYTFTFRPSPSPSPASKLPSDGKIEIKFNTYSDPTKNFDLSNVVMASMSIDSTANVGGFSSISVTDPFITLMRDGFGIPIPSTRLVTVRVAMIRNPKTPINNALVEIKTYDSSGNLIDNGSAPQFSIYGPIDSFNFTAISPTPITAGTPFNLGVTNALDTDDNNASGWVFVSVADDDGISPNGTRPLLNPIYVSGGSSPSPASQKLVEADDGVRLRGLSGSASKLTDSFAVQHAALDSFYLRGVPNAVQVNTPFPDTLWVAAVDSMGNRVRSYGGKVTFSSSDDSAKIPPADYTFSPAADQGRANFSGSDFVFATAGEQWLQVNDKDSPAIGTRDTLQVVTTALYTFDIAISSPVVAGQPATVTVSNFKMDSTLLDGTVHLSFADGLSRVSPNGTAPVLNDIVVQNGKGSANIVLYNSETSVGLKAKTFGADSTILVFDVAPGSLSDFSITGLPADITAGQTFGGPVTVTARDPWGNTKTDFTAQISFSTGDGIDVLPAAITLNAGVRTFNGSQFQLNRSGLRRISVSGGGITTDSSPIQVRPAAIAQFSVPASLNVTAGIQFNLTATDVWDAWGNPTSGLITVTAVSGGGNAPNGQAPIIKNISAVEGQGENAQVLVRSESVVLRCTAGGTSRNVNVTVAPGALSRLALSGVPDRAVIGLPLSGTIGVSLYDGFSNPQSDYSGTLVFSSSDASAGVPAPSSVTGSSASFAGSEFVFNSGGQQTLSVEDSGSGQSVTSAPVAVNAVFVRSVTSNRTQVGQGQSGIRVSMEVENLGAEAFTITDADLRFTEVGALILPDANNLRDDYSVNFNAIGQAIAANSTRTLNFDVAVYDNAKTRDVIVGGHLDGLYGAQAIPTQKAALTHTWSVVGKALLDVVSIDVKADTIFQGQSNVEIELELRNIGTASEGGAVASALVENSSDFNPFMWSIGTSTILPSNTYTVSMRPLQNTLIAAGQQKSLYFDLTVPSDAQQGEILVQADFPYTDAVSNVVRTAGAFAGDAESDTFRVEPRNLIEIVSIAPSQSRVTQNQAEPWTVAVAVHNSGPTPVAIDFNSSRTFIEFREGLFANPEFAIIYPTSFSDASATIESNETKEILFEIVGTTSQTGIFAVWGEVQTVSGVVSNSFTSNVVGTVEVLPEDDLRFVAIQPSQPSITRGAEEYGWYISVILRNAGGTEVQIDFDSLALDLPVDEFSYDAPGTFTSGDSTLKAGEEDTLLFTARSLVFAQQTGERRIGCEVGYRVLTTGQFKKKSAGEAIKGQIDVQTPAILSIVDVHPDRPFVSAGVEPNWNVVVVLRNDGGADIAVDFDSTQTKLFFNDTIFGDPQEIAFRPAQTLAGGDSILRANSTDSLVFSIDSIGADVEPEISLLARVRGREINRNLPLSDLTDTPDQIGTLRVQKPAAIEAVFGTLKPAYVALGTFVKFQLDVQNSGESTLTLDPARCRLDFVEQPFLTFLDPGFPTGIQPDEPRTLYFNVNQILSDFPKGNYTPRLTLVGSENDNAYQTVLTLNDQPVTVGDAGELSIQAVRPSLATATTGQTVPWTIDIEVENNGVNPLDLDSLRVEFFYNEIPVSDFFTLDPVETFLSGSNRLAGNQSDTLRIPVLAVAEDAPLGIMTIRARLWMTDAVQTTRQVSAQTDLGTHGYVSVQSSGLLLLRQISSNRTTVTRGQTEPWSVSVEVYNGGGSELVFPLDAEKNRLEFSRGSDFFTVELPESPLRVNPGQSDVFAFTVTRVDTAQELLGLCDIDAVLTAQEVNTNREYSSTLLQSGEPARVSVAIQDSARARIDSLAAVLARPNFVNSGQSFLVRAKISNAAPVESGDLLQSAGIVFSAENPEL